MEGFQINYTDLSDLFWEYKRKIENLIENIDNCIERINTFTENAVFTGKTGDAVKSYLGEAHITILSGIKVTAQTLLDNMAAYKDGYRAIDSSTNFKLDEEAIQEFRKKLASNYEDTDEYTGKIRSALSEVSDISDVGMPDSNGVFDIHEQMDSDLIKLVSNVNSYERENVVRLENSVELLLENLQSCLSKIGLSQGAIESYETGSFITGKDAGTLNTGIKIFGDLHEKNKEAYDEIYETEQKIKDEAEKRKTQGIWRTVGGAVLIATGAACIVLTGGAATPVVADVAVAVGSGTAVFGAADAIEGTQDIYYGSTGDIDSTAVNGIKDDLFQGNEDAYYLTENAFAFAASAMIPIGQASTAGNLTFKSTATIVAKEGISMGVGAGAQKITTDVTGNDTAGMVAGMVASGVTAKGLNGIEAEANKLAKAPKGIDGVTEKAGNLAEDVGKAGKGLEGAAKGAESAAEDAGKVVESGTYSGDLMSAEEAARYSEYWRELGIGSDNTWKAFKDANPNGTIDDYFEIVQKQSPWPLGETGTPTTLKAGDRFFMAVENNAPENVIGGFGVKERIDSTDFVRNNLAVKYDWKTSCNVIREFEVNSGIELNVNAGPVGPQIDLGADLYLPGDTTMTQYDLFSNLGSEIKREDYVHIIDEYWVD
ncbi:MAG: T7SS effector LXG polymorphic toxin [Agathobacter rectalis]